MIRTAESRRGAVTLIELVLSMSVATVLMGGLASAVVIASHAMPDSQSSLSRAVDAQFAAQRIAGELYCARSFTERSATVVEFTVADRDNDDAPETIRYEWSATPGDPITRRYNGGTIVNIADDVHEFDLSYLTQSLTTTETKTVTTVSDEVLLAYFNGWPGIPTPTYASCPVGPGYWTAQSFAIPTLPDNATNVTISRVRLQMSQGNLGGLGAISVAIHRAQGGGNPEPVASPTGTPVVSSSAFLGPMFSWVQINFNDVVLDESSTEYVVVVKGSGGAGWDAYLQYYYDKSAPSNDLAALWSEDGGASWAPANKQRNQYDFPFWVYGTYEITETLPVESTQYFLKSVGVMLRMGSDASTHVDTSVEILNQPEVPNI